MKKDALEERAEKGKKDNEKGEDMKKPIKHIHVHAMDNGGYTVRAESDYGMGGNNSYESAHPSAHSAMKMVRDHMTSPHLPKLGSGERFSNLKDELSQQPGVYNPAGLAASIGRKKFGAKKFSSLGK